MTFDRRYLLCALVYAVLGLSLGIYMAASHNHAEFVTHAHILLVGFVVSFVYGTIHKLWLVAPGAGIANLQFYLHQLSAIAMASALFLLFGNMAPMEKLEPILAIAANGVLLALLLMIYMVVRFKGPR
jgi:hypothetical protein